MEINSFDDNNSNTNNIEEDFEEKNNKNLEPLTANSYSHAIIMIYKH